MNKEELIAELRKKYIPARVAKAEPEFIEFEEDMGSLADLNAMLNMLYSSKKNPHNSALLYILGITDEYNPRKHIDTMGGSLCDIDTDFDTLDFPKIMEWLVQHYGREGIANIMALQKFKPRSTARKYFMVTAPKEKDNPNFKTQLAKHEQLCLEILQKIPPPLFGKEPTLDETINGNPKKGYKPQPELLTDARYKPWLDVATNLEGMVSNFGIHAAGVVISDFPISDVLPLWYRKTKDEVTKEEVGRWITQFTMEEVETHGLLKFDFLRIENLSIIKVCRKLIEKRHGVKIAPYEIPDGDEKAYKLLSMGLVAGLFQMETSNSAKVLSQRMRPKSLLELSDLSALNRPGPLQAGMTEDYIENKNNGYAPLNQPAGISELLKGTYWTLVYQEQVMAIVSKIAGFTLKEADTIRKAIGKKDLKKLSPYRQAFIDGCNKNHIDIDYATDFWDKTIVGCAD